MSVIPKGSALRLLALPLLVIAASIHARASADSTIKVVDVSNTEAHAPNPKAGASFRFACRIDIDEHGIDVSRFIVHAPLPEQAAFARRAGRFLGQIWRLAD